MRTVHNVHQFVRAWCGQGGGDVSGPTRLRASAGVEGRGRVRGSWARTVRISTTGSQKLICTMAMVVGDGAAQAARRQHTGAQAQQQLTRWRTPGSARAHAGTPTAPSQSGSARSSSREPAAGPGTAGEHGGAWRHWGRVKPRTDAARQPGVHHPPHTAAARARRRRRALTCVCPGTQRQCQARRQHGAQPTEHARYVCCFFLFPPSF